MPGSRGRRCAPRPVLDAEAVRGAIEEVKDPEIPVLSVIELGMVRGVAVDGGRVEIDLTPTYSACPAFDLIREAVVERVQALGAETVTVRRQLAPPWSSDAISDSGRAKLRAFGIAPPDPHRGLLLPNLEAPVPCPRCGSFDTELRNAFGSALCREIHGCRACGETFERFKPL